MTLQEIIDSKPNEVNYIVQNIGNQNENERFLVNSWNSTEVFLQKINTINFFNIPLSSSGYEIYNPPLEDPLLPFKNIVLNAIEFFDTLVVVFAAENIQQGITQANKTREVADYLSEIMRYGQSGSLYEVITEIDTLISNGVPSSLIPFITEQRLNDFKNEIINYLQG